MIHFLHDKSTLRGLALLLLCYFLLLGSGQGAFVLHRVLSIEDMESYEEHILPVSNGIAHVTQRVANFIGDNLIFFVVQTIMLDSLPSGLHHWLILIVFTLALWLFYFPYMEWRTGRTLMKLLTQTKVVSSDDELREPDQMLKRNFLRFIPFEWVTFIKAFPIGWHDSFSDTRVIDCYSIPEAPIWQEEV